MKNVKSLKPLYKRDSKGKLRIWTVEVGFDNENVAGIRSVSGLVDGEKVTSGWNMCVAKNVGKVNATTAKGQAEFEAQAQWTKKADKEYFAKKKDVDSYELFKPMLAHDFTKKPVDSGYTQPKLDGIRCIVDKNGMHTRAGKAINSCPHIWESLKHIIKANPNIVLDGELYNHKLKADFQKITSLVRKLKCRPEEIAESAELVEYHIYDMFDRDNEDMIFTDRAKWLVDNVEGPGVVLVKTTKCKDIAKINEMYGKYTEAGYEGQMIRQNVKYECKRSNGLLKRKEFITEEFDVVAVEEGQGSWAGYAKKFTLKLPDGRTFSSGVRGSQNQLRELLESKKKPDWATCRFFELSNDGVPRFPVVIDYGTGKRED
jgi:DNA ligase-1